jgi:hypothetical protein
MEALPLRCLVAMIFYFLKFKKVWSLKTRSINMPQHLLYEISKQAA